MLTILAGFIMLVVGRWCYFANNVGYFQGWLCCVLYAQV